MISDPHQNSGIERSSQPELTFSAPPRLSGEKPDPELLDSMTHWLHQAGDWLTAAQLCRYLQIPASETNKRRLRDAAQNSHGAIAGGQKGYKLIQDMTRAEYNHYRNWMTHQADAMKRRILQSDKHFYSRKPL